MRAVRAFEPHQRAQRLRVVIEPAMIDQCPVERLFTRMAERRMADIVREAQRLGQILVQPQRTRDHASDLRHLQAVGQAGAIVIARRSNEHLRLAAQAAKGDRVDDPVAIALERGAWPPALRELRLIRSAGKFAPARTGGVGCEVRSAHAARVYPPAPHRTTTLASRQAPSPMIHSTTAWL